MKNLMKLTKNKTRVPILEHIAVRDNVAYSTNLNMWASIPVEGIAEGIYSPIGFDTPHRAKIDDLSIDDMPMPPKFVPASSLKVDAELLHWAAKAMSKEETRYYLRGVALNRGHVVATDGHRLHVSPKLGDLPDDLALILPAEFVNMLPKKGAVVIEWNESACVERDELGNVCGMGKKIELVRCGNLMAKAVDGAFPDWQRVYETETAAELPVNAKDIKERVKLAELKRKQAGDKLPLLQIGEQSFNAKYALDMIDDNAMAAQKAEHSPLRFDLSCGRTGVLMPVKGEAHA